MLDFRYFFIVGFSLLLQIESCTKTKSDNFYFNYFVLMDPYNLENLYLLKRFYNYIFKSNYIIMTFVTLLQNP